MEVRKLGEIISDYRKSGDKQKIRIAEILQVFTDMPKSELVKVLFEREKLKTEISLLREQIEFLEKQLRYVQASSIAMLYNAQTISIHTHQITEKEIEEGINKIIKYVEEKAKPKEEREGESPDGAGFAPSLSEKIISSIFHKIPPPSIGCHILYIYFSYIIARRFNFLCIFQQKNCRSIYLLRHKILLYVI